MTGSAPTDQMEPSHAAHENPSEESSSAGDSHELRRRRSNSGRNLGSCEVDAFRALTRTHFAPPLPTSSANAPMKVLFR